MPAKALPAVRDARMPKKAAKGPRKAQGVRQSAAPDPVRLVKPGKKTATVAVVDFESYYSTKEGITLKKLGYYHYLRCSTPKVKNPRDFIYMVSIVCDDGFEWVGHPADAPWSRINGLDWLCWNAMMEMHCEERLRELKIIPASVKPRQWIDVSQMAVYMGAPRNLEMAQAFFYKFKADKTMRGKASGKSADDLKQLGLWDPMCQYALNDGRYPLRIWQEHEAAWPAHERELARQTIEKAMQGVFINKPLVGKFIKKLERMMWEARKSLPWVEDADVKKGALSTKKLAEACRAANIPVPPSTAEDDPACEAWENKYGVKFGWVAQMRVHRKANLLLGKLYFMRDKSLPSGRMRYSLKYFGGHTGRWSGDGGFNIQNPNKEPWEGIDLRACICAPPGQTMIMADLSQIEPRVLYWICGLWPRLERIAKGESIYEVHARETMGWTGGNIKKEDPAKQFLAKQRVLALGYGCGWEKFRNRCAELGVTVTDAEAKAMVKDFRRKEKEIVDLWDEMDTDFKQAAKQVGGEYKYQLPSGRWMTYRNIQVVKNRVRNPFTDEMEWRVEYTARTEAYGPQKKLYGGLLVENLVQATSRDVFAAKLLALTAAGFNWTFHVHDEVIIELPKKDVRRAEALKNKVMTIIREPLPWLEGCPLESEAAVGTYYTK